MTLPTARNYTQNTAAPIQSTLLNALQDCVVGMKRPSAWRWINPATPNVLSAAGTNTMQEDGLTFGNAGTFTGMPLGIWNEGDRITAFAVRHLGTGVAWTAAYLLRMNIGGTLTTLGTLSIVTPPAAWATYTLTLGSPQTLPVNASLYLSQTTGAIVSNRLGLVGVQSDRL